MGNNTWGGKRKNAGRKRGTSYLKVRKDLEGAIIEEYGDLKAYYRTVLGNEDLDRAVFDKMVPNYKPISRGIVPVTPEDLEDFDMENQCQELLQKVVIYANKNINVLDADTVVKLTYKLIEAMDKKNDT